jgi:hypothetical protein
MIVIIKMDISNVPGVTTMEITDTILASSEVAVVVAVPAMDLEVHGANAVWTEVVEGSSEVREGVIVVDIRHVGKPTRNNK